MTLGPGKYADLCTFVRGATEADAAILIIINGRKGSGFSAIGYDDDGPGSVSLSAVVKILEDVIEQMKKDLQ